MRRYDAVFLDAQGTLLQSRSPISDIYVEACRDCGGSADAAQVSPVLHQLWVEHRQSTRGRTHFDTSEEVTQGWWRLYNGAVFDRLGMSGDRERFIQQLWDNFGKTNLWQTYPEVEQVLAELKGRGYRLGVVSNWDSRLLPICDSLGITGRMEFVLASALVGVEKPDRRIFEMALQRMSLDPERAIHVGDDYEADVMGARGAGVAAVHLDRDGMGPADGPVIDSLEGLLELLP
jgi:putative hydrolase of the HAD superfamily